MLVPPRVCAAVLRTLWNGWTSHRRFGKSSHCLLGRCGFCDEDSIEQYSVCPTIIRFARSCLHLTVQDHLPSASNFATLGLHQGKVPERILVLRAIMVYAAYRTTHLYRNIGPTDSDTAFDSLKQFSKEAARGHRGASEILDYGYIGNKTRRPSQRGGPDQLMDEIAAEYS